MKKKFYPTIGAAVLFLIGLWSSPNVQGQTITTVAGNGAASYSGDWGLATAASLNSPNGVIADASGNYYISDAYNHRVRKVKTGGVITTLAGNGTPGSSGDGGPATAAEIDGPSALAVDGAGNIYVADLTSNNIRKINTAGIITTFAGTGSSGYSGDGGPATAATFSSPYGIVFDAAGNLYVADEYNHCIRKINTSGIISTIAGLGYPGFSGDGGPASDAALFYPNGICVDGSGNIFVTDNTNHRIRKINTAGIINTYAGNGTAGFSGDGGPATDAEINFGCGIKVDASGNMYFAQEVNNCVRKISSAGIISTIAGNSTTAGFSGDGGPATAAEFNQPLDIAFDATGNLMIADLGNNRIRSANIVTNHPPYFIDGASHSFSICANAPATSINTALTISDADTGQTETWSVHLAPTHGTLGGFTTTAVSTGGSVTPTGLTYTPATGYAGMDTFSVMISDGTAIDTIFIYVTVVGPGTISGPDSVCIGDTVTLSVYIPGGTWGSTNSAVSIVTGTGQVVGVSAGTDSIMYSIVADCSSDITYFHFTVRSAASCGLGTALITATASDNMTIFPNPNQGSFIINLSSVTSQYAHVAITNVLGQKVKEMVLTTNKDTEVNINVTPGVYFVSAEVGDKQFQRKIMVQ